MYATATATQDPSLFCDIHQSSQKPQILTPLREARDQTHVLMDTSWVCYHWVTMGTPKTTFFIKINTIKIVMGKNSWSYLAKYILMDKPKTWEGRSSVFGRQLSSLQWMNLFPGLCRTSIYTLLSYWSESSYLRMYNRIQSMYPLLRRFWRMNDKVGKCRWK